MAIKNENFKRSLMVGGGISFSLLGVIILTILLSNATIAVFQQQFWYLLIGVILMGIGAALLFGYEPVGKT